MRPLQTYRVTFRNTNTLEAIIRVVQAWTCDTAIAEARRGAHLPGAGWLVTAVDKVQDSG